MRGLRFSLRTFLILTAVAAVLFAAVGKQALDAHKQRQLISLIRSYGGEDLHELNFPNGKDRGIRIANLEFSPRLPGPEWLRMRIGDEYFVSVAEAFFDKASHRVLDDDMFAEFAAAIRSQNLPRPSGLVFSDLPITDQSFHNLSTFPNLTSLHLYKCPGITDDGLKQIAALRQLRRLNLRDTSVTDRGLAHLSNLKELRELSLTRTAVTDVGLSHLEDLKQLEYLALSGTSVTNDAVRALNKHLPNCTITW